MGEEYDWGELLKAVDLVADTFPGARLALAAEIAAEALDLPDGHEGKARLLEKCRQLRSIGRAEDLRNLAEVYGNVVSAGRGETVTGEVLGSGDAGALGTTWRGANAKA